MKCNSGKIDRTLRIIAGLVIIALGLIYSSWWGLVGLVPLLTGACGVCLLYLPFGITTCKPSNAGGKKEASD